MLAYGAYPDIHSQIVIEQGASPFMPDVSYQHLKGKVPGDRDKAYSSADIFTFTIDNMQE